MPCPSASSWNHLLRGGWGRRSPTPAQFDISSLRDLSSSRMAVPKSAHGCPLSRRTGRRISYSFQFEVEEGRVDGFF